jgi:cellulose synthase/poly-beta-1,6-N-acetylglucosamine synthase-like glycosyltransferase
MVNFVSLVFWISVFFILYVYLGYPLLLTLFARLRQRLVEYSAINPGVTLLIAAYNEQGVIARKLENSLALDYPAEKLQILVAADGSNDLTVEIVQSFSSRGVEISYQPERRGKMAAINRALPEIRHDIIAFSDANNLYDNDTLNELMRPFSDPRVGAVSGSKNVFINENALTQADGLYWRYESYIKEQETRLGSCTGVSGEILAVRRDLFRSTPDKIINDDFFIAMHILRQGYRVVYTSKARSYEHSSLTEGDEDLRRSRIVAGRFQAMLYAFKILPWKNPLLVWQIISHKFMRPIVPLAMFFAFMSNLILVLFPPALSAGRSFYFYWLFSVIMLSLQFIFYLFALLGNKFKNIGWLGKVFYLPKFLVNSNLSAVRGFFSFVLGKQSSLWQRARRHGELSEE